MAFEAVAELLTQAPHRYSEGVCAYLDTGAAVAGSNVVPTDLDRELVGWAELTPIAPCDLLGEHARTSQGWADANVAAGGGISPDWPLGGSRTCPQDHLTGENAPLLTTGCVTGPPNGVAVDGNGQEDSTPRETMVNLVTQQRPGTLSSPSLRTWPKAPPS